MYYFYGKINRGHADCLLYGGSPYLGESVMGGSTVQDFLKFQTSKIHKHNYYTSKSVNIGITL